MTSTFNPLVGPVRILNRRDNPKLDFGALFGSFLEDDSIRLDAGSGPRPGIGGNASRLEFSPRPGRWINDVASSVGKAISPVFGCVSDRNETCVRCFSRIGLGSDRAGLTSRVTSCWELGNHESRRLSRGHFIEQFEGGHKRATKSRRRRETNELERHSNPILVPNAIPLESKFERESRCCSFPKCAVKAIRLEPNMDPQLSSSSNRTQAPETIPLPSVSSSNRGRFFPFTRKVGSSQPVRFAGCSHSSSMPCPKDLPMPTPYLLRKGLDLAMHA